MSWTPAAAVPAKKWSTASRGTVRKYLSGLVVNVQPSITSRYNDMDRESTTLLPARSAILPHTLTNNTLVTWLSMVNPITDGRENPSRVSIYTAKNGTAKFRAKLESSR